MMRTETWRRMIALAALAGFFLPPGAGAEDVLELRDGRRIRAPYVEYVDGDFRAPEGETWSRQDVRQVWFEKESKAPSGAESGIPSEKASGDDAAWIARWFAEAGRLQEKYPDVQGIILVDEGTYELRADGTRLARTRFVGKILKTSARDWGRIALWFEEERQRIRILRSRTILPDGTIYTLDPDAFRVSEPYSGLVFFNRNKVLSGELPRVAPGCLVDIEYEVETYNPFDPEMFFPGFLFQSEDPVALSRFTVVMPEGRNLYWRASRMPEGREEPETERMADGRVSYVWEARDQPPLLSEPRMPAMSDVVPVVRTSVFKDWGYIMDWLRKAQDQRIVVTPGIQALADRLAEGAATDREKIARLYPYLQREIRYVSIKGGIGSGFSGHRADETLRAGYGDCIDKAILFAALAKALGIRSDPVILMTNDRTDHLYELPVLAGNHAISKFITDEGSFFLDATATTYRFPAFRADDQGAQCINAQAGKIETIDLRPPGEEGGRNEGDLALDASGDAKVRYVLRFSGTPEARMRARVEHSKEEELRRYFTEMVGRYSPDARLVDVVPRNTLDLSAPFYLELDFELPGWGIEAGDLMIVGIPGGEYRFVESALEERRYDIEYSSCNQQEREVRIRLPAPYRVLSLPEPVRLSCAFADYESSYEPEDGGIVYRDRFRRRTRIVPRDSYPEYRDFLRSVARTTRERIFLRRVESEGREGEGR